MLLFSLGLSPNKWSVLLKGFEHRLPNNLVEYRTMQGAILRERILEDSVFSLRGRSRLPTGGRGSYMVEQEVEPRFLYMCLGDPGGTASQSVGAAGIDTEGPSHEDVYDGHFLFEGDDSSDCSSDEQWAWQNSHDPISPDQLSEFASASLDVVGSFYWAMRKAIRRYRAAAGKFGPGRRLKGSRARKRFKGSGARRFGKS